MRSCPVVVAESYSGARRHHGVATTEHHDLQRLLRWISYWGVPALAALAAADLLLARSRAGASLLAAVVGGSWTSVLLGALAMASLLGLWARQARTRHLLAEARRALAARISEHNAAEALRQGNDAVLLVDAAGAIVLANERAAELYGYPPAELSGLALAAVDADLGRRLENDHTRPGSELVRRVFEAEHRRRDGARLAVEISLGAIVLDGAIYRQCIVRDVSDRKRSEVEALHAEQRWRFALESAGDGAWDCNMKTGEIVRSPRCLELYGLPADAPQLHFADWHERLHPADRDDVLAALTRHLEGLTPVFAAEYRLRTAGGSYRWFLDRGKIVERDPDGQALRMIGTLSDIQQRKQAEIRQRLLGSVFAHSNEAIVITEADGTIVSVNDAFTRITGYTADEVVDGNPRLLKAGLHDAAFYAQMWAALTTSGRWTGEIWNRRKSGELYPAWLSIAAVGEPGGRTTHYVSIQTDISERKADEERVRHLASHDVLTGLPNRSLLRDRLQQAVLACQRNGSQLAVIFLDLDRFKPINDTYGHAVGDLLLRQVADRLRAALRESDTVARLGGDEFVVLLPDLRASHDVAAVGAKLAAELERPFEVEGQVLSVSTSLGIALFPEHGTTEAELLRRADAAMYEAKQRGHGIVELATGRAAMLERRGRRSGASEPGGGGRHENLTLVPPPGVAGHAGAAPRGDQGVTAPRQPSLERVPRAV